MMRRSQRVLHGLTVFVLLALYFGVLPLSARVLAAGDTCVAGRGALVLVAADPVQVTPDILATQFNPEFTMEAVLPTGSLGLPGEPITWVLRVTNTGLGAGEDIVITNTLRDELQIEDVVSSKGDVAVSEQMILVTVPELMPAASVEVQVHTTVRRGPPNGVLLNQALLAGQGPGGAVSVVAVAEVFVPTGLPSTGYPPGSEMPGEGEPSLAQLLVGAVAAITVTAYIVYRRGQR
jgi:hypothetical protein